MSIIESLQYSIPITALIMLILHIIATNASDPAERNDKEQQ